MIDILFLRNNPEDVKKQIVRRKVNPEKANVDLWLTLDEQKRALEFKLQKLQEKRNLIAQEGNKDTQKKEAKDVKEELQKCKLLLTDVQKEWQTILDWIPNMPFGEMPDGKDDTENIIIKTWIPEQGYIKT